MNKFFSRAIISVIALYVVALPSCLSASPTSPDVMVRMRDGVSLATDLYLPEGNGPWPVVLGRTPYGKTNLDSGSLMLPEDGIAEMNQKGIAVVIQDTRGRFNSEGPAIPFFSDGWGEDQDGLDCYQWLINQPWCNGRIAMLGASAGGITQILLAGSGPQTLAGQWIGLAHTSLYHSFAYTGGVFRKEMVEGWLVTSQWPYEENYQIIRSHYIYDNYWQTSNLAEPGIAERLNWPVVVAAGWYDLFLSGSIDLYQTVRNRGGQKSLDNSYLFIGPYTHTEFGLSTQGELTYPDSAIPYGTLWPTEKSWIDHWLLDIPLDPQPARVTYYTMGQIPDAGAPGNEWRTADNWPPLSVPTTYYLTQTGQLTDLAPSSTDSLSYVYDPNQPVATIGGQNFMFPVTAPDGPYDQSSLETRPDVLTFTTRPFSQPTEFTGKFIAEIYVSTTALDTDFTGKITDVYPNGKSMLVMDSVRRLQMRGDFDNPLPVTPGEVYRLEIDLGDTSMVFGTGHRLRLAISSSNNPRFLPNPNTGDYSLDSALEPIPATQTIYFSSQYPSRLILPLVEPAVLPTKTPVTLQPTQTMIQTPPATAVSSPTPTARTANKSADFNQDGRVDRVDLIKYLELGQTFDVRFDLNNDGEINATDLYLFSNTWTREPSLLGSYSQTIWPTIHRDGFNSDFMPFSVGVVNASPALRAVTSILDGTQPSISMGQSVMASNRQGKPVVYLATGKITRPNLWAVDQETGMILWSSKPAGTPTDIKAGPDSCAVTSSPIVDSMGRVYISDCHYVYCYDENQPTDQHGQIDYLWRVPMPNLKVYDEQIKVWKPTDDPTTGDTFAKPFLSMFLTTASGADPYLGGISIDGEIFLFDPANGELFAEAGIQSPAAPLITSSSSPCDPWLYAMQDNPLEFDREGISADKLTPFGIWTTGQDTDHPDNDYFMNPCQIFSYLEGNTLGGGSMVTNTPAIIEDPQYPYITRIYINTVQSIESALYDQTPAEQDVILYRIDFNPTESFERRLTIRNYQYDSSGSVFYGRMPDGQNSATSPTVAVNGKWIYTADKNGVMYAIDAEDGSILWQYTIGTTMGSPTISLKIDTDGCYYLYAFGNHAIWSIGIDPDTGQLAKDPVSGTTRIKSFDFVSYLTTNAWRNDDPGYAQEFLTKEGKPYQRNALGASIVIGAEDKLMAVYSMGWSDPDNPTGVMLLPTHSVIVFIDRNLISTSSEPSEIVEALFIDTWDTCEIGFKINPASPTRKGIINYGAQSTSMGFFQVANDLVPEGMAPLLMTPKGGLRILQINQ